MEFTHAHLKYQYQDQVIGIPCVRLSEPDENNKLWIHLYRTHGIIPFECIQEVSTEDLLEQ